MSLFHRRKKDRTQPVYRGRSSHGGLKLLLAAVAAAVLVTAGSALYTAFKEGFSFQFHLPVFEDEGVDRENGSAGLPVSVDRSGSRRDRGSMKVAVDPGHGGEDPGTSGGKTLEKDINLAIGLLLEEKLKAEGVQVVMTRDGDDTLELEERSDIANEAEADAFISIHCNSYKRSSVKGAELYWCASDEGKKLAETCQTSLQEQGVEVRFVREQNYSVIRESKAPGVLVETGYITSPEERKLLLDEKYQDRLAAALCSAVLAFLDAAPG